MTYNERINIMDDALFEMVKGSELLEKLHSVEQSEYLDKCSPTALKTSKGKLDCAITWLVNAMKWEIGALEERRKEEGE